MYNRTLKIFRIPSLLLAGALQILPVARPTVAVVEASSSLMAIIFRWAAGAAACLGAVDAVSGASTVIAIPLTTNLIQGKAWTQTLVTAPLAAHYWTATGFPDGIGITTISSPYTNAVTGRTNISTTWFVSGTPTVNGIFNVSLMAKDKSTSLADRTTTATLVITVTPPPPVIDAGPTNLDLVLGQQADFAVFARDPGLLSYQWRLNQQPLSGQSQSKLVIPAVSTADSGLYDVVVSGAGGSITSSVASLNVLVPATITTQPSSVEAIEGAGASFTVGVDGTRPLTYRWRFNGNDLPGQTNDTLAFASVSVPDAGDYSVAVANGVGCTTSSVATLSVVVPPGILSGPAGVVATNGQTVAFTVAPTGTRPLSYHWFFNGNRLEAPDSETLTLNSVNTNNMGIYQAVVSNRGGSATSAVATLSLRLLPPAILQQPLSRTNPVGGTAVLSVVASSSAPETYQWFKNGLPLESGDRVAGVQSSVLTLSALSTNDAVTYWAVVANDAGSITSRVATLSIKLVSPIRVRLVGSGKVVPDYDGRVLEIGKRYSITTTPSTGWVFGGWSGTTNYSDSSLVFTMADGMELQALSVAEPFTAALGSYAGLFYETNGVRHVSSGIFSASTTMNGTYSGSVVFIGQKYPIAGRFDGAGRATNFISRPTPHGNLSPLVLEMQLDFSAPGHMTGRVTGGTWSAPLLADRVAVFSPTNPAPQVGSYTMLIPGESGSAAIPAGHGYAKVDVSTSGKVTLSGYLADGTPITQTAALSEYGTWPLYVSLYGLQGSIAGWLNFVTNQPCTDIAGAVTWSKLPQPSSYDYAAGFLMSSEIVGSKYVPPTKGCRALRVASGQAAFNAAAPQKAFINRFEVCTNNLFSNQSSNWMSIRLNPSSGSFDGRVLHPATRQPLDFRGVLLQKQNIGGGFFINQHQSGSVHLTP